MGHVRLSRLPRTRKWKDVVNLLINGECTVQEVAEAAAKAASDTLKKSSKDATLNEVIKLLCLMPRVAKEYDFQNQLANMGVYAPNNASLTDIIQGFYNRINHVQDSSQHRTDLGELAKHAAVSVLMDKIQENSSQLWEPSSEDIRHGLAMLSNPTRFGDMTHSFLSTLTGKLLRYYLDRETPDHISQTGYFSSIQDMRNFEKAIELHCVESSMIMRRFAQDWYGKTYAQKANIDYKKVSGFLYVASNKIIKELEIRGHNA